jgi:hypothetical protein
VVVTTIGTYRSYTLRKHEYDNGHVFYEGCSQKHLGVTMGCSTVEQVKADIDLAYRLAETDS